MKATLLDTDMSAWAPGTRHYRTEDGRDLAVHVDGLINEDTIGYVNQTLEALGVPTLGSGVHQIVVGPTTIIVCTESGEPIHLTPSHSFPPGTTHEMALRQAGFEV